MLTIKTNIRKFVTILEKETKLQNKALVAALNKTARQARTAASKAIREDYNITATDLNKKDYKSKQERLGTEKASEKKMIAKVVGRGAGLPVKYFKAKQVASGVSFSLRKGKRKIIKSAFGPKIPRLGGNVFLRETEKRLPIKLLYTTGVANMLGQKNVSAKTRAYISSNFSRIFTNELKFYTQFKK